MLQFNAQIEVRELQLSLQVTGLRESEAALESLADKANAVHKRMAASSVHGAKLRVAAEKHATRSVLGEIKRVAEARRQAAGLERRLAVGSLKLQKKTTKEQSALLKTAANTDRALDRTTAAEKKKIAISKLRLEKRLMGVRIANAKRVAKSQIQTAKAVAKSQERIARQSEQSSRARQARMRGAIGAPGGGTPSGHQNTRQSVRDIESATSRLAEGGRKIAEGLGTARKGVLTLSRGLSDLGIIGEENAQRVEQAFAKLQSITDTVQGGVQLFRGISTTANGIQSALSVGRTAGAVSRLAPLAGAGSTGGIGLAGAGGTAAVGVGGTIAAAAAALAGVAAASVAVVDTFKGISKFGFGGGVEHGSFSDVVATKEVELFNSIDKALGRPNLDSIGAQVLLGPLATQFLKSIRVDDSGVEAAQKFQAQNRARQARMKEDFNTGADSAMQRIDISSQRRAFAASGGSVQDRIRAEKQNLRDIRQARLALENELSQQARSREEAETLGAEGRIKLLRREAAKRQEIIALERQASEESLRNARQNVQLAEQKLLTIQQELNIAKGRKQSDLEKFGALSPIEQRRARHIIERIQAGKHVSEKQFQQVEGFDVVKDPIAETRRKRGEQQGGDLFLPHDRKIEGLQRQQSSQEKVVGAMQEQLREQQSRSEAALQQLTNSVLDLFRELDAAVRAGQEKLENERARQATIRDASF